jgi:carboxylesterase type B
LTIGPGDHASEISYVFGNPGGFGGSAGPEDATLSRLMSSYWVDFAKSGDPSCPGLPVWPVFDEKQQETMFFIKQSGKPHPDLARLKAFDARYAKLREESKAKKWRLEPANRGRPRFFSSYVGGTLE